MRPRQNGWNFADVIFKCIFLNENVWILLKISQKFVPKAQINNIPALDQIMAWYQPGDKPLSGLMMVSLLMHSYVTRPQWVKIWMSNCIPQKNTVCNNSPIQQSYINYFDKWSPWQESESHSYSIWTGAELVAFQYRLYWWVRYLKWRWGIILYAAGHIHHTVMIYLILVDCKNWKKKWLKIMLLNLLLISYGPISQFRCNIVDASRIL